MSLQTQTSPTQYDHSYRCPVILQETASVEINSMFQAISWPRSRASFVKAEVTHPMWLTTNPVQTGQLQGKQVATSRWWPEQHLSGEGKRAQDCMEPRCQGSFRHTRALQLQVCESPAAWGIQDLTNSLLVFNSLVPSDNEFNVSSYLSVSFWVIALIRVLVQQDRFRSLSVPKVNCWVH